VLAQLKAPAGVQSEFPPKVEDFYPGPLFHGGGDWATKFTLFVWIAVAAIIIFFLVTYRDPKVVPTKKQWLAESIYGFGRNTISGEMLGHDGVRFAPYLTTLFCFIAVTNFMGIIPFFQTSPNSHIAFPAFMAVITYVMFIYAGIKQNGAGKFFKNHLMPPAPWFMMPFLIPIELFSTFIARPATLALRLFANMFAGHMILLVFTLGGFALLGSTNVFIKPVSLLSFAMAIALTFLEALVALLQAYVFTVLTASYLQGALADEH